MIAYTSKSLFETGAQTLVNPVNCAGAMGKGLALDFRRRHPEMFAAYKTLCENGRFQPGMLWLWKHPAGAVLNFPTKVHWRDPSDLKLIALGLTNLVSTHAARGITSIAFPKLGCGLGGLDWHDVEPVMTHHLSQLPIPVLICATAFKTP